MEGEGGGGVLPKSQTIEYLWLRGRQGHQLWKRKFSSSNKYLTHLEQDNRILKLKLL